MSNRPTLGDIARDQITGFEGVVIAETKWLHGCRRMTLQPQQLKDGKPIDAVSFDEPQLVLVQRAAAAGTSDTGGPRPEPTRAAGVMRGAAILLALALGVGCTPPDAPTRSDPPAAVQSPDRGMRFGPMFRLNGKGIGFGTDLGGGLSFGMDGSLGISLAGPR